MRWLAVVAAVAALVSGAVNASEPVAESMPVTEAIAPILIQDLAAPTSATRPARLKAVQELRPAGKPKLAKKPKLEKSMLSRTVRNQMALAVKAQPGTLSALDNNDDDSGSGLDNLDLHRSFARPRVVANDQDDDQDLAISDHARLRLFLARMKAVEAHKAARAADKEAHVDQGVSEEAKLRLFLARMKAVQAHQKKFS